MTLAQTYKAVKPACVAFARELASADGSLNYQIFGSGAIIGRETVVTARHVVFDSLDPGAAPPGFLAAHAAARSMLVVMVSEVAGRYYLRTCAVQEAYAHSAEDLALLRVAPLPPDWPVFQTPATFSDLSSRAVGFGCEEGDPVAIAGFPLRTEADVLPPTLSAGVVSRIDFALGHNPAGVPVASRIVTDIPAHAGISGAPLFHSLTGSLLGVVVSHERSPNVRVLVADAVHDGDVWSNVTYCVPWTMIPPPDRVWLRPNMG